VHESIAFAVTLRIGNDFAGQNTAKVTEGVVQGLIVDSLVQIFDENIALSGLAEAGVSVRPHYPARPALNWGIIKGVQSTLSINVIGEVDISIAKRMPCYGISANANGGDGTDSLEDLEEKRFSDGRVKVSDVERCRLIRRSRSVHLVIIEYLF